MGAPLAHEQRAMNDLRAARQGIATARRNEGQAERAYERACAAWLTGKHPVEQVEEAEQALDDARLMRRRVEAAKAHLDPLVPRLAGT